MGLRVSHGAWDGSYRAFDRFRRAVCEAHGGSWPRHDLDFKLFRDSAHEAYFEPNVFYLPNDIPSETYVGIHPFLAHSDCDGYLSPEECLGLARALRGCVGKLTALDVTGMATGHILSQGGFERVCLNFINACTDAAEAGERLEFS